MSRGVNKVILLGNLGGDPETRYTQSGDPVTNFSVATSESWKDKQGETQEKTEWHNVVCFKRLAEVAGEYLAKGSKVYIEGKMVTQSWEKDGVKHYRTQVQARELQMLGGNEQQRRDAPIERPSNQQPAEDFEDDIPFAFVPPIPLALLEFADVAKALF